mgnify:CR=1 FL=1
MDSREVLEDALADFGGTIITVSHDRYFINRIANRIIEMQPDGVTEYIGNYDDYIERKNRPVAVEAEAGKTKTELEKEKRREKTEPSGAAPAQNPRAGGGKGRRRQGSGNRRA